VGDAKVSLVFFPLYPWLVRGFAFFVGDYLAAAIIVSGLAAIATGLLLKRLVACDETEAVASGGGLVSIHFSDQLLPPYPLH
jgi:hypothetical protein